MRNRVFVGLLVVMLLVVSGIGIAAQDDNETPVKLAEGIGLETDAGLLALSYPAEWIAQTSEDSVLLSNVDGVSGLVTFAVRDDMDDPEISAQAYLTEQFLQAESASYENLDTVQLETFNGREAAVVAGVESIGAISQELTVIVVDAGAALVTFVFSAPEGEAADNVYAAIVGGVDFAPTFEPSA